MLLDRDRWSHLDNLEEIREIIRVRGWSYTIGYLQAIEEQTFPDQEMEHALENLREVARRTDDRIQGIADDESDGSPSLPSNRKVRRPKRRS